MKKTEMMMATGPIAGSNKIFKGLKVLPSLRIFFILKCKGKGKPSESFKQ